MGTGGTGIETRVGFAVRNKGTGEIRPFFEQFNALVSKVKVCLALGQEWVALEILHPSYVSNEEMQAHLDVVDLNRNVSHPEYRYVTRPDTNESLCS